MNFGKLAWSLFLVGAGLGVLFGGGGAVVAAWLLSR